MSTSATESKPASARTYPARPIIAVSAAIVRERRVLIARRARAPANGVYTLPGGVVEVGETLREAVMRALRRSTGYAASCAKPVALAGYRERIARDANGGVEQHFVILPFAARWVAGEPVLNEELAEARWLVPSELAGLTTTEGLAEIVAAALEIVAPGA